MISLGAGWPGAVGQPGSCAFSITMMDQMKAIAAAMSKRGGDPPQTGLTNQNGGGLAALLA